MLIAFSFVKQLKFLHPDLLFLKRFAHDSYAFLIHFLSVGVELSRFSQDFVQLGHNICQKFGVARTNLFNYFNASYSRNELHKIINRGI